MSPQQLPLLQDAKTQPAAPRSMRVREMIVTYRNRPKSAEALERVTGSADVARAFDFLRDLPHEEVWALLLSADNRPVGIYLVGKGTTSEASVAPREVFKAAILANAAATILVHNHPSGNSVPSAVDRRLTEQLIKAAELMAIPLLDHVILGLEDRYSFADHGLIEEYRRRLPRTAGSD